MWQTLPQHVWEPVHRMGLLFFFFFFFGFGCEDVQKAEKCMRIPDETILLKESSSAGRRSCPPPSSSSSVKDKYMAENRDPSW